MIERVARAIAADNESWPYDRRPWSEQRYLLERARAVLAALREPTSAMVTYGGKATGGFWTEDQGGPMDIVVDGRGTCTVPVDPSTYDPGEPADAADALNAAEVWKAMIDAATHD